MASPLSAPSVAPASASASAAASQAEEGRLRGISRSIIVGVGGTGRQIMLDVRKRLIEKYGSLEKIPIVAFLLIDTDQAIFSKDPDYSDEANLDAAEKIHASVHGVDALRSALGEHPHLRDWLDPRVLTGDIDQGAGAVRARGRLAYFWNYSTIAQRLEAMMLQVTKDSSHSVAIANGLQVGEGITVYVVGSLLGGTGSGMFLDLAYTIKNKFRSQQMLETVGMFSIPPNSEAVAVDNRPNAYAALVELNHYTDSSTTFRAQYKADIPPMEDADPPFRYAYLSDTSSPAATMDSVKDLVSMIGHSIFLDLTSEFQRQKKSNRNNFDQSLIVPDGLGCPQNYMGFGLASIYFPKDKVISACSSRLAGDIVRRWTTPLDRVVNVGAFTDQEMAKLGLAPDEIQRQLSLANTEGGETMGDRAQMYWTEINRRYGSAYPGHNRVADYLSNAQREQDAKMADTDPNPDFLAKSRGNLGESVFQIQQNLSALITAKEKALRQWVSACVNDPRRRHSVASAALDTMAERIRGFMAQMDQRREERRSALAPLAQSRSVALEGINRYAGDFILNFVAGAKRKEIDEQKDLFLRDSRSADTAAIDARAAEATGVFYRRLGQTVADLRAEMDRYVERMETLQARFDKAERLAVQEPAKVNGVTLFSPGHVETDASTGSDRYVGGDIDDRYAHYVGNAADPNNIVVNNLAADILQQMDSAGDIWKVRDQDLNRASEIILSQAALVFAPVAEESVLDKFFSRYGENSDTAIATLRQAINLSQPFLHLQENAPNYSHNINKEQTIVGVLHGAMPRTESEKRFETMITETVAGIKDQQITNSNEAHQVLLLRERAAFPLRLLQGMQSYRFAYEQVRFMGAAANPIHTRIDVKEWVRISPPSAEAQKAAWSAFVVGWAAGVVKEERTQHLTRSKAKEQVRFTAQYVDKFGMPKSDVLGAFEEVSSPIAGFAPSAQNPNQPPLEARGIVQRLCDDPQMQSLLEDANEALLRKIGPESLGAQLVTHARLQNTLLQDQIYEPYYRALANYLEQIGYSGESEIAAVFTSAPAPSLPPPALPPPSPAAANGNGLGDQKSVKDRLQQLQELRDHDIISLEEYESQRRAILGAI